MPLLSVNISIGIIKNWIVGKLQRGIGGTSKGIGPGGRKESAVEIGVFLNRFQPHHCEGPGKR